MFRLVNSIWIQRYFFFFLQQENIRDANKAGYIETLKLEDRYKVLKT